MGDAGMCDTASGVGQRGIDCGLLVVPGVSTVAIKKGVKNAASFLGRLFRRGDDVVDAACSFSGETEVVMADGITKPIDQVEIGDWVLAHDPETGETGARQVTHVWVHDDVLVDLGVDGSYVTTTEDHPFWNVTDESWQRADQLDPGDQLLTANGGTISVDGIAWTTSRIDSAYNLTVNDIHTYHVTVGTENVLVHNTGCERFSELKTFWDDLDPGKQRNVKLLDSDGEIAQWFAAVTAEATVVPGSTYPGILMELADGSLIGCAPLQSQVARR